MAYCRFSDTYEVYCYAHVDGSYVIHMAYNMGKRKDGEVYKLDTPQECLQKLKILKREGYVFDEHAIERLKREIKG